MPQNEKVLVVDFGGQYNQLVARRVRECNVYCEIVSYRVGLDAIRAQNPKGIIFTGGPNSVYVDGAPTIDPAIFDLGIPVLGLCYGFQLMTHLLGGHVCKAPEREYGKTLVHVDTKSKVFENVSPETICWMRFVNSKIMNRINIIPTIVKNVITILRPIEYPCVVMEPKKISIPAQI